MSKKLDIKEVLKNIDANNTDWYMNLPDEDKKGFDPFIVMQFLSSSSNNFDHADALELSNHVLNKNFSDIYQDKELFYRLACVCRSHRKKAFRPFVKPPKSKKSQSLMQRLASEYACENVSQGEAEMIVKKNLVYGIDYWQELAESLDWSDADIKKLIAEIKQVI